MPPALVLETSCWKINLRVIFKSGHYNNKEASTKLHHAKRENHQKVDHFKNDCNCTRGKGRREEKWYLKFLFKKKVFSVCLHVLNSGCKVFPLFIAFKFFLVWLLQSKKHSIGNKRVLFLIRLYLYSKQSIYKAWGSSYNERH